MPASRKRFGGNGDNPEAAAVKKAATIQVAAFFLRWESVLHLVAFLAIGLDAERILLFIVAGAAGGTAFHLGHGCLFHAGLEGKELGVAVGAFEHAEMIGMVEDHLAAFVLEDDRGRFEAAVAALAVASG